MTTCLLCSSPAVADGLCVEDGARLWAACYLRNREHDGHVPNDADAGTDEKVRALRDLGRVDFEAAMRAGRKSVYTIARAFLDRLDAARKVRAALREAGR